MAKARERATCLQNPLQGFLPRRTLLQSFAQIGLTENHRQVDPFRLVCRQSDGYRTRQPALLHRNLSPFDLINALVLETGLMAPFWGLGRNLESLMM
jgi:hypothetical protein